MAKFDVYRMRNSADLVIDCQADLLSDLTTRFVVPLLPIDQAPKPAVRLNPIFAVEGRDYVMVTQFASAIVASEMTGKVTSLASDSFTIGNALDMLVSGF